MATAGRPGTPKEDVKIDHVDFQEDLKKPQDGESEAIDKFGSHAKTDPKEIALVRKLDLYLMVSWITITIPRP